MSKDQTGNYITAEKRLALEAELEDLRGPKRKEILEALKYAKSLGDLSENAEYHQAREDQGKLESRIMQVEQILNSSETVTHGGGDTIGIGSKIILEKEGTKDAIHYVLVGSEEANTLEGKISNKSPLGIALLGKKKGGEVSVVTPKGKVNYKIISVS